MKKKDNSKKIIKVLLFCLTFLLFLLFSSQLNFTLKEDSKVLGSKNLLFFLLNKQFLAKKIFMQEPEIIGVNFKINFKKMEINIEKIKDEPVAIICSRDCFYLSSYSYIYKPSNGHFSVNKIKIFSVNPVYENSYLLPQISLALAKIFEYSNIKFLNLQEVFILSNFDLKVKTPKFSFLVDPFKNVDQQLKKLSYFIDNYKKTPYNQIDLRIPQKIFFK